MEHLNTFTAAMQSDESGVTAIEYGLLAALISVVLIVVIGEIGISISGLWTTWTDAVDGVNPP